eukprot:EG_transcript_12515
MLVFCPVQPLLSVSLFVSLSCSISDEAFRIAGLPQSSHTAPALHIAPHWLSITTLLSPQPHTTPAWPAAIAARQWPPRTYTETAVGSPTLLRTGPFFTAFEVALIRGAAFHSCPPKTCLVSSTLAPLSHKPDLSAGAPDPPPRTRWGYATSLDRVCLHCTSAGP